MARFNHRRNAFYVMLLMAVYVALLWFVWPRVRDVDTAWLKVLLAVSPSLAVAWVVWLMVRRVMLADELEQRLHLISLGVATALVGTACLVAGLLAMAKVWQGDGAELFWVFPVLCLVYGFTQLGLKRHVTGVWDFWGC